MQILLNKAVDVKESEKPWGQSQHGLPTQDLCDLNAIFMGSAGSKWRDYCGRMLNCLRRRRAATWWALAVPKWRCWVSGLRGSIIKSDFNRSWLRSCTLCPNILYVWGVPRVPLERLVSRHSEGLSCCNLCLRNSVSRQSHHVAVSRPSAALIMRQVASLKAMKQHTKGTHIKRPCAAFTITHCFGPQH